MFLLVHIRSCEEDDCNLLLCGDLKRMFQEHLRQCFINESVKQAGCPSASMCPSVDGVPGDSYRITCHYAKGLYKHWAVCTHDYRCTLCDPVIKLIAYYKKFHVFPQEYGLCKNCQEKPPVSVACIKEFTQTVQKSLGFYGLMRYDISGEMGSFVQSRDPDSTERSGFSLKGANSSLMKYGEGEFLQRTLPAVMSQQLIRIISSKIAHHKLEKHGIKRGRTAAAEAAIKESAIKSVATRGKWTQIRADETLAAPYAIFNNPGFKGKPTKDAVKCHAPTELITYFLHTCSSKEMRIELDANGGDATCWISHENAVVKDNASAKGLKADEGDFRFVTIYDKRENFSFKYTAPHRAYKNQSITVECGDKLPMRYDVTSMQSLNGKWYIPLHGTSAEYSYAGVESNGLLSDVIRCPYFYGDGSVIRKLKRKEPESSDNMENGELTYDDGSCYKGEWRNGLKHGQGLYTFNAKVPSRVCMVTYEGAWENDKLKGYGVVKWSNGSVQKGVWDGLRLVKEAKK